MKTIKIFLLLGIQVFGLISIAFPQQCPPSVLKIQSPICDTPKNLNVSNIKCATIQLNWQGNKEQKYIVAATSTGNAGNTLFEIDSATYSCNESGNCYATINVKEGATLNWNVQAICNINGVTIYSPKVEGRETVIPYCLSIAANAKTDSINTNFRVYPNPTVGYLIVEYYSKAAGIVQLKISDVSGKIVFEKSESVKKSTNVYPLDLRNLVSGTYLLSAVHGNRISQVKFILLKK